MTKKSIFFGLFLFILCFLCNWYSDLIIGHFTGFTLFFIKLFLLIIWIIFLVKGIKDFNKIAKKGNVLLVILLVSSIFSLFCNFRWIKTNVEFPLYRKQRERIIEKVKDDEFAYYFDKNIKLPIYKYVSSDGEIYVYRNDREQVISFWIYRGVLSGNVELIYSSGGKNLIYEIKNNSEIVKIVELDENWYYVESSN